MWQWPTGADERLRRSRHAGRRVALEGRLSEWPAGRDEGSQFLYAYNSGGTMTESTTTRLRTPLRQPTASGSRSTGDALRRSTCSLPPGRLVQPMARPAAVIGGQPDTASSPRRSRSPTTARRMPPRSGGRHTTGRVSQSLATVRARGQARASGSEPIFGARRPTRRIRRRHICRA